MKTEECLRVCLVYVAVFSIDICRSSILLLITRHVRIDQSFRPVHVFVGLKRIRIRSDVEQ